jgi:hypothetical protein
MTEGAARMFGQNLDKVTPLSVDQLDPTRSFAGTAILPVAIPFVYRALKEYSAAVTDNPRIALLEAKERELLRTGSTAELQKVRDERQRLADIDAETRVQRILVAFERNTGLPGITFLKDSMSPTNLVYAIANSRLDYARISAERLTKAAEAGDYSLADAYSPYLTKRKGFGADPMIGQNYTFDYQKFYQSIKGWLWEGFPEALQETFARAAAATAYELDQKLSKADMYFNALTENGVLTGTRPSITQEFARNVTKPSDRRLQDFQIPEPYPLEGQSENLQREAGVAAGSRMRVKSQPKEVDSTFLEGVLKRLKGEGQ